MDPASLAASLSTIIQASAEVIKYFRAFINGSKERREWFLELCQLHHILTILDDHNSEAAGNPSKSWSSIVDSLATKDGPISQLEDLFKRLKSRLEEPKHGIKKLGGALIWPFKRSEINELFTAVERYKSYFIFALDNDHM